MPGELVVPLPLMTSFLLTLCRVSGVVAFVPLPGVQSSPEAARIILALALSIILMPVVNAGTMTLLSSQDFALGVVAELSYGLLIGVAMSLLLEGLQMAAHIIGLQAGYSFASTIDPSTEADSAVLQVLTQLFAGIVFFALGFDRKVIRTLAVSFKAVPLAVTIRSDTVMEAVIGLGSQVFLVGLRLAMPVMALLLLSELSFAVVAKVHSQFHMQSLSFPSKMLTGLGVLAICLSAISTVWSNAATHTFEVLSQLIGK